MSGPLVPKAARGQAHTPGIQTPRPGGKKGLMPTSHSHLWRLVQELSLSHFYYGRAQDGGFTFISPSFKKVLGYPPEAMPDSFEAILSGSSHGSRYCLQHSLSAKVPMRFNLEVQAFCGAVRSLAIMEIQVAEVDDRGTVVDGIAYDVTAQRAASTALKESERKYRELFENAPVGIGLADSRGNIRDYNQAMLGPGRYSPRDIERLTNVTELYYQVEKRAEVLDLLRSQGKVDNFEVQFKRKDGTPYDTLLSLRPIELDGQPHLLAIVQDISARKEAERNLQISRQRYRNLVETTSDWIWQVDADGSYTYSSPKVKDILGYGPAELLGKTPFDLMPPAEAGRVRAIYETIVLARRPFAGLENTNLTKDGQQVVLETSGVPVFDEQGYFAGYRGIDRDITRRKEVEEGLRNASAYLEEVVAQRTEDLKHANALLAQEILDRREAEEALRKSERHFRTLVDTMNEGLVVVDAEEIIRYVNPKLTQLIGFTASEIIGRKATEFLDQENQKIFRQEAVRRRQGAVAAYELTLCTKDGHKVPTMVSPTPLRDEQGQFGGSMAVLTDISALKQTEKDLRARKRQSQERAIRLQEANTALKVLLKRREADRTELADRLVDNVKELVVPYLQDLRRSGLSDRQACFVEVILNNLDEMLSPFVRSLSNRYLELTPTEIRVANLVKQGKTSKEIAGLCRLSVRTVEFHRDNLRRKLGIKHKNINLCSHLRAFF